MTNIMPPGPLAYEGDVNIPYINRPGQAPTTSNFQFQVPTFWIDTTNSKPWILVSKPQNVAKWLLLGSGSAGPVVQFTPSTGIVVTPNSTTGNVNVFAGAGITVTGTTETLTIGLSGGLPALETLSDDVGTVVTPTANNIQLVGHVVEAGATKFSTVVAGSHLININPMSASRWIVDPLGFNGSHTTIASAIASATSGDTIFIMPGTYTENLTLKAGVNLASYGSEYLTGQVIINGTCTCNYAGQVGCNGITFQTNGANPAITSASGTPTLKLAQCNISALTNTAITANNSSFVLAAFECGMTASASNAIWVITSGSLGINRSSFGSANTTPNSIAAGVVNLFNCSIACALSTSSTGSCNLFSCTANTANVACLTTAGTGSGTIYNSLLQSGTAPATSIGAGTSVTISGVTVNSSNANVFTGAGTLIYGPISFVQGSGLNSNVTTQTPLPQGITVYNPSQPAFLAYLGTQDNNVTGDGTSFRLGSGNALTKVYDQGNNFNTNGTFTAPLTARYQFTGTLVLTGIDPACTLINVVLNTSNRVYSLSYVNPAGVTVANAYGFSWASYADMDAADTATVLIQVVGGAKTTDIAAVSANTTFAGSLIC